jgi:hypothetical protein
VYKLDSKLFGVPAASPSLKSIRNLIYISASFTNWEPPPPSACRVNRAVHARFSSVMGGAASGGGAREPRGGEVEPLSRICVLSRPAPPRCAAGGASRARRLWPMAYGDRMASSRWDTS